MIKFKFNLFTKSDDFPIHIQYGFHEENDCFTHGHEDFSELVIVLDGSAEHTVNNESYGISKGDVFVINQDTEHGFNYANHMRICNIMFKPEEVFANVFDIKQLPGFQALFVLEPHYSQKVRFCSRLKLKANEFKAVENMITDIIEHYDKKDIGWKDYVSSSFMLLCIALSRLYNGQVNAYDNEFIKLADAIAYIENNYCGDISTHGLAAMSGYSERQFLRLFKSVFSTTPNLYILNLRIKKAQQLLKSSNLTIGEIAWNCGYDDHNYFSRIFKKHTDMTPSEYRALAKN